MCVGAFCVGTDQVDLDAATRRGIPVFNAPFSNTRSVVELAVGAMITLMRRVPEKNRLLHAGTWDKSSQGSREIRGKKLGIVGYGKIGSQLGVLAEALGMDVLYYRRRRPAGARECEARAGRWTSCSGRPTW